MGNRIVTEIPVREKFIIPELRPKTRVAVYARVSTSSDEQLNSIEAQKSYYESYVMKRPEWVLVDIYADEGITGTSYRNREEFKSMIDDALAGKIDLIITKSLSRFARNTVDTLMNIRLLKSAGVAVFFEKEDINTLDAKGEFMLTLLSSMAQEESRNISENVTWGYRTRMQKGQFHLAYSTFLGYCKGKDCNLDIVPEEKYPVRIIYYLALIGGTSSTIVDYMESNGFESPRHKHVWYTGTIQSILQNEKYCGDALLQKTFVSDFLTKEVVKNTGQLPKYFIANDHEPIVAPIVWHYLQDKIAERTMSYSSIGLSAIIQCGTCGGNYHRIVRSGGYTKPVCYLRCKNKYNKSNKCGNPIIYEKQAYQLIRESIIQRLNDYPEVMKTLCEVIKITVTDEEKIQCIQLLLQQLSHQDFTIKQANINILVKTATITPNRIMKVEMIDGRTNALPIPYWTPCLKMR